MAQWWLPNYNPPPPGQDWADVVPVSDLVVLRGVYAVNGRQYVATGRIDGRLLLPSDIDVKAGQWQATYTLLWDGPVWQYVDAVFDDGRVLPLTPIANQPWAGAFELPIDNLVVYRFGFKCAAGHRSFNIVRSPWVDTTMQEYIDSIDGSIPFVGGIVGDLIDMGTVDAVWAMAITGMLDGFYCYHGHKLVICQGRRHNIDYTMRGSHLPSNRGASGVEGVLIRGGLKVLTKQLGKRLPY